MVRIEKTSQKLGPYVTFKNVKTDDNMFAFIYEKNSDEVKLICDAYADGVNRYIEKNNIKSNIYPARGKDVVAGFCG